MSTHPWWNVSVRPARSDRLIGGMGVSLAAALDDLLAEAERVADSTAATTTWLREMVERERRRELDEPAP